MQPVPFTGRGFPSSERVAERGRHQRGLGFLSVRGTRISLQFENGPLLALVRYRALANAGQLQPPKTWGLNKTAALVREQLIACKRYSEALADAREQVAVYRQLAMNRPDLHNVGLADALIDFAELLEVNGYRRKAAKARAEAQACY